MAEKLERELRFAITSSEHSELLRLLRSNRLDAVHGYAAHEFTVMFDNPNPDLSFYQPAVDGRLRLRTITAHPGDIVKAPPPEVSLLTWKQRIPAHAKSAVRTETEIEVPIEAVFAGDLEVLLSGVLQCPRVSSYERTRETLHIFGVEVALDRFPYGHVIELELKDGDDIDQLHEVAEVLSLPDRRLSQLSCDDMYRRLCEASQTTAQVDILFDDTSMPSLDDFLKGSE